MSPQLLIHRQCRKWPEVEPFIEKIVTGALAELTPRETRGLAPELMEMGITLTCDRKMRRYNRRYRGRDKATNILSFALNEGETTPQPMVGDLLLSCETITREAKTQGKTFEAHLAHLLVHGVLHLFGHDHDRSKKAANKQESREIALLSQLGYGNPYVVAAPRSRHEK